MKTWVLVLVTLLLTGCATKAYRAVERECAPQAWADYPENKVQVVQTRQRVIHVATGMDGLPREQSASGANAPTCDLCLNRHAQLF